MSKFITNFFSKEFFKKDIAVAMVFAFIFTVFLSLAGFDTKCEGLRQNILRLHILANSDSDEDQALKLKVRDEILKVSENIFDGAIDKEDAISCAEKNIETFEKVAESVIKKEGKDYPVKISVAKATFDTRQYDGFTLPAGEYDAVRVLIGKAEGKNWWCVMFPAMCIPAAGEKHSLAEAVPSDSAEIAENAVKYEIKFKSVEIYESIKRKMGEFFHK